MKPLRKLLMTMPQPIPASLPVSTTPLVDKARLIRSVEVVLGRLAPEDSHLDQVNLWEGLARASGDQQVLQALTLWRLKQQIG